MTRTALVLGGMGGIGAPLSRGLLERGYTTIVASRSGLEANEGQPSNAALSGRSVDLLDSESIEQFCSEFINQWQSLDVLVITAGTAALGDVAEIEPEDLSRMLSEHVIGPFHIVKRLIPLLEPGGHIVFLLSRMGRSPRRHGTAYGTAKAATEYLAASLALALREKGIRVNSVSPGAVSTPMFFENFPNRAPASALDPKDVAGVILRILEPEFDSLNGAVLDLEHTDRENPGLGKTGSTGTVDFRPAIGEHEIER